MHTKVSENFGNEWQEHGDQLEEALNGHKKLRITWKHEVTMDSNPPNKNPQTHPGIH